MGANYIDHDTNWSTTTDINSSAIADAGNDTTEELSNDQKVGTEVSVTIAYGATATEGIKVYVLRDVDGTNFEAVADNPWGFEMPYGASTTHRKTFTVPGDISDFKVHLTNDGGASVTATVRYRQAVITTV